MITTKPKPLRFHKRATTPAATPVPAAPTLVAAGYADGVVTLAFDRPVDVADFAANLVGVDDGTLHAHLGGGGTPTQPTARTVVIEMESLESFAGVGVTLSVAGDNGLVAVDGGLPWAGVAGLALPFG